MAWLSDEVLDGALNIIANNADTIYICNTEPTTIGDLSNTSITLGASNTTLQFTGPSDRSGGGRELTIGAANGAVTASANAAFFAVANSTVLMVTGSLTASQPVTDGNSFALGSFTVGIPDPA